MNTKKELIKNITSLYDNNITILDTIQNNLSKLELMIDHLQFMNNTANILKELAPIDDDNITDPLNDTNLNEISKFYNKYHLQENICGCIFDDLDTLNTKINLLKYIIDSTDEELLNNLEIVINQEDFSSIIDDIDDDTFEDI